MIWLKRLGFYGKLIAIFVILFSVPTQALAASVVSQGYKVAGNLPVGAAVSLQGDTLVLATPENQDHLFGVVVNQQEAAVSLSTQSSQTQVVASGLANVIVTDINGDIKTGDELTPSPIAGVVMKATEPAKSIGVAQQDMSTQVANFQKRTLKANDGSSKTVNVALLSVLVNIDDFRPTSPTTPAILLPLQSAYSSVSGKPVTTAKAIIATIVLLVSLIATLVILYSAAASSIRSVGRNPTAKSAVFVSLLQVVGVIAVIFVVAFGMIIVIIRG